MKCYIVEDLLPEYVEELCGQETRRDIEEHLSTCKNCKKKWEEMKKDNGESAVVTEDLQPFQKIKRELKKNRINKMIAIVLLIIVCGVFGTLTVGQIFPALSCPSYDSLMYRYEAKHIAQKLVDGEIKEVLKGVSTDFDVSNPTADVHEIFFDDIVEHLTGLHEKVFKDKDITIHVDSVTYLGSDDGYRNDSEAYNMGMWYRVMLTLKGEEGDIFMSINFDNSENYSFHLWLEETEYDCNNVMENTAQNSLAYNIQEMNRYLYYYMDCCQGFNTDNYLTNERISAQNFETVTEDESHLGFFSYYFTRDCTSLGVMNAETGCTDYSREVGLGICKVLKRCQSNDFRMINRDYNEDEKKYNAILYWTVTDLKGKQCIMMKRFYFGPTGYEPVDNKETIYSEDGFDRNMIKELKGVFD